jgi:hypothetical protein
MLAFLLRFSWVQKVVIAWIKAVENQWINHPAQAALDELWLWPTTFRVKYLEKLHTEVIELRKVQKEYRFNKYHAPKATRQDHEKQNRERERLGKMVGERVAVIDRILEHLQ